MKYPFFIALIFSTIASCQDFGKLKIVASLPKLLDEASGVTGSSNNNFLWMVNDSGGKAEIYGFDVTSSKIVKTILLADIKNIDWEDLASDTNGNIYVGDFGNNFNKRKDLTIYTVKKEDIMKGEKVLPIKTTFYFEDQKKFPPKHKDRNFDVEAFFYKDAFFYLFTRNRSSGFDGTTKLYRIPVNEGSFKAELLDSYKTCGDAKDCQVTSACLDPLSGRIALLSYNKVWIISDYVGDDFFHGNIHEIKLGHYSQKEGISFKDTNTLYITDERNGNDGGNVYELSLKK